MTDKRRSFLKNFGLGVAAAGGALAAPALMAAEQPNIKWRLASSFPKGLDTIYGNSETIAKKVAELTDGKFQIEVFAGGTLMGAFDNVDACQKGTIEIAHTAPYYFYGKDPTFSLDCAIPWGMNARQMNAWYYDGNGLKLFREFYAERGMVQIPSGNTGAQMGGWFRKEIKSVSDLAGVRMRTAGLAADVLKSMGVVPKGLPGGQIIAKFNEGELDAAEWVGPYDDEKLGLAKVAPYYYYPGFWEGSTQVEIYIGTKAFASLPASYKAALESACAYAAMEMLARYDSRNGPALQRMISSGTKTRAMPQIVLDASFKVSQDLYSDLSAKNPAWKKIFTDYTKFQKENVAWSRYAENTYDNYVSRLLVR